ncbi:PP2C family serine/threonine-protein phosphatase [Streptomyces sp. NBC_01465]|uniref:PP2C family serine/threonine-protein phosphatase n=1 Tax=Streptomyces sp. NBC_01465 TaxID=2903878 RepID=UPI002E33323D|nr:PP2C family serine/threonine-protein phosphatase [Streptomyces sp. NBC_01465]
MSQTNQPVATGRCPGCEEPVEAGDLFCGACGHDLSAVTVSVPGTDRPTVAVNGAAAAAAWPAAPAESASAAVQTPTDLAGTTSGGTELPTAVRTDDPPEPAEYPLPDPRTVEPTPAAGTKICVACRSGRIDEDGYCENCGHAQPRERDHMEEELGAVAAVSDRGLRHHRNEDSYAVSSTALPDGSPAVIAVVCDGVSSATRPDEASAAAAVAANEALLASLPLGTHPQQAMHEAILAAAESVNSLVTEHGEAMEHDPNRHTNAPACTIVSAIVAGGLLVVGWVGDSRVYWVPDDRTAHPSRLTEDDSWAAQMVATGLMNEEQAYADERAHAITGWLGADAYELEPHTASFKPDRPGVVVVCTDGLWNYAEGAEEMAAVVPADAGARPLHGAQVLVGHALDGGGHDNVTVAVLPFLVPRTGAGSA